MQKYNKLSASAVQFRADELSSVSEYVYLSIIFADTHREFSELCERIALDEMRHYKMLSEFIFSIGGDVSVNMRLKTPSLCACSPRERSVHSALLSNIRAEKEAAAGYLKLASTTGDLRAARLFNALADEENKHIALLSAIFD